MKISSMVAAGFVLAGLVAALAGPSNSAAQQQTPAVQSAPSGEAGQAATPKAGLSKRNRAVIEQQKAKARRDKLASSGSDTTPQKKNLSKRNKAMLNKEEAHRKMHEKMVSESSASAPK